MPDMFYASTCHLDIFDRSIVVQPGTELGSQRYGIPAPLVLSKRIGVIICFYFVFIGT